MSHGTFNSSQFKKIVGPISRRSNNLLASRNYKTLKMGEKLEAYKTCVYRNKDRKCRIQEFKVTLTV